MSAPTADRARAAGHRGEPILSVRGLQKHFPIKGGGLIKRTMGAVRAVDGLDLDLYPGEVLGLVGESGCGKSTTGRAILNLQPATAGSVRFQGRDMGAAVPHRIGVHVHPAARSAADQQTPAPVATGIDYLALVHARHTTHLADRITFADLPTPTTDETNQDPS